MDEYDLIYQIIYHFTDSEYKSCSHGSKWAGYLHTDAQSVYVPTEMQNTKGVFSIYIEGGGGALYLQSGREGVDALEVALFESTTPPLAIQADPPFQAPH